MLRAITVDDESSNHVLLKRSIEKERVVEVVAQFTDPLSLLEQVTAIKPEVVFVDIEMPVMNGLEMAEKVLSLCPETQIVFVTAYSQYAIEAFRVNALDYLLKPIDDQEMKRVISKLINSIEQKTQPHSEGVSVAVPQCRIHTLGGFEVYGSQSRQPVQWLTAKVEELLGYLLMHANRFVGKEKLCEVLWPDSDYEKGLMNLYTTVYRLRKTLIKERVSLQITCGNNGYQVQTEGCILDYQEFERLTHGLEIENMVEAEKIYQGELFGNRFYLWSAPYSEAINQVHRLACYGLAEYFLARDAYESSAEYLQKILNDFPDEERACMLLMAIFKILNNKAAIVERYHTYIRYLEDELNVKPSPEFQKYYDSLLI